MAKHKCKRKEWKHVIFSDDSCQFDEFEKSYKESHPDEGDEYTWDMYYDDMTDGAMLLLSDLLNDRRCTRLKKVLAIYNHHAQASASGRRLGYKMVGDKLSDIFNCSQDSNEYYCDQDDVQAVCSHHDGTNYITYRVIKPGDEERVEDLLDKMAFVSDDYESDVLKATHSLVPYVADIFGWKYDRRMKRGDMWNPRTYKSSRKAA